MLEDLQKSCEDEGWKEAKTYEKFACFCKDMTSEKLDSIQDGKDAKDSLEADIAKKSTERDETDTEISELEKLIAETVQAMKEATATRAKERAEYEKEAADLAG